jgi:hypothetical protein
MIQGKRSGSFFFFSLLLFLLLPKLKRVISSLFLFPKRTKNNSEHWTIAGFVMKIQKSKSISSSRLEMWSTLLFPNADLWPLITAF